MSCHFQIVRFLKADNKYRKGRIDGRSDTKQGKQLLAQLKTNMAIAKAFKSLLLDQILSYTEDSSEVLSISSKEVDNNIENIIKISNKEDVEGNYNINQTTLI